MAVGNKALKEVKASDLIVFPIFIGRAEHLHSGGCAISKIFLACGIRPQHFSPQRKTQLALSWQELTLNSIDSLDYINQSYLQANSREKCHLHNLINGGCNNISKSFVSDLNKDVFGRELNIDPTQSHGLVVKKSDLNGKHDGTIVQTPINGGSCESESVFNILVDNVHDGYAVDLRVIYINGLLDFFYEKKRKEIQRFSNANDVVTLKKLSSEFSKDEISRIEIFCQRINADYGELDILRDRTSGCIYIVDFANTPTGPPNGISKRDYITAIELMSIAFIERVVLHPRYRSVEP